MLIIPTVFNTSPQLLKRTTYSARLRLWIFPRAPLQPCGQPFAAEVDLAALAVKAIGNRVVIVLSGAGRD